MKLAMLLLLSVAAFVPAGRAHAQCLTTDTLPTQTGTLEVIAIGTASAETVYLGKRSSGTAALGYCIGSTWTDLSFDADGSAGIATALERATVIGVQGGNDNLYFSTGTCGGVTFTNFAFGGQALALWGQGGNDTIYASSTGIQICGGSGDDTLLGGNGVDNIDGYIGDDFIEGGGNSDSLWGYSGLDTVVDVSGMTDSLHGETGNDACVMDNDGTSSTYDGGPDSDTCGAGATNCETITTCWLW